MANLTQGSFAGQNPLIMREGFCAGEDRTVGQSQQAIDIALQCHIGVAGRFHCLMASLSYFGPQAAAAALYHFYSTNSMVDC